MRVQSNTVARTSSHGAATRTHLGENEFARPALRFETLHEQRVHSYPRSKQSAAFAEVTTDSQTQQDKLYAEFRPLVCRLIRQYGDNAEIRNDLEGEIYYRFRVLLKAYDPNRGVPLRPYLVRQLSASTYTFARQYWRRQHREISLEQLTNEGASRQYTDPTADWVDAIDLRQLKGTLPVAISKLSERQRTVLILRYYEDRSFEEIANRLAVQTSTARSLLRHALNHLRADMAPPK